MKNHFSYPLFGISILALLLSGCVSSSSIQVDNTPTVAAQGNVGTTLVTELPAVSPTSRISTATALPTIQPTNIPTNPVSLPTKRAPMIAIGRWHSCVLTTSGGVKCWGNNRGGQIGLGKDIVSLTPADVPGLTGGVASVFAGGDNTCALTTSGGVKCWGTNIIGQVTGSADVYNYTPVDIPGLPSGIQTVDPGYGFICVLLTSGGVKCWGNNYYGSLGNGTTTDSAAPVDVVGLTNGVTQIAVGATHACALNDNGGVQCWGDNAAGNLGDGTTIQRLIPVDVSGLDHGVKAITAGAGLTCALTDSGGVKCWGWNNNYGQVGDGTKIDRPTPVDVVGLTSSVKAISTSGFYTCALTDSGGVKCWGANDYGDLGDGSNTESSTPVDVVGLSSGVVAIDTGESHTCALTAGGDIKCWGRNYEGELGDGTVIDSNKPVDVVGFGG